jgi:hypothetical protein
MSRRRSEYDDDGEFFASLASRETIGSTLFWLVLWAICGFNFWVGIGFFFAWGGSIGLFHDGKKRKREAAHDGNNRGFDAAKVEQTPSQPETAPIPPLALYRQVIADADPARVRLEAAASAAGEPLGARLRNMVSRVKQVVAGLETDPSRLSDVQRLFTYYLPATADLLAARGALAGTSEASRLSEIDTMIGKLDLAYDDFAARLSGHDARSLELDLRLLDQAIDQEFVLKTKA